EGRLRHAGDAGGEEKPGGHHGSEHVVSSSSQARHHSTKASSNSTGSPYCDAASTTCGSRSAIRKPLSISVVEPTFTVMSKATQSWWVCGSSQRGTMRFMKSL